jgi:hypothetical protein
VKDWNTLVRLAALLGVLWILVHPSCKSESQRGQARDLKARGTIRMVAEGLESYRRNHGAYPVAGTWEDLVSDQGPLVKGDHLPPGVPALDPWGQAYHGESSADRFRIAYAGDPDLPDEHPSEIRTSPGAPGVEGPETPRRPSNQSLSLRPSMAH